MEKACERAREGDLQYFETLSEEDLVRLIDRRDEDGRTLLHAAVSGCSLPMVQALVAKGAGKCVNLQDDEVLHPTERSVWCGPSLSKRQFEMNGVDCFFCPK